MTFIKTSFLEGPHGRIAFQQSNGSSPNPGVIWLGGFRSDMTGTKAQFLADWAEKNDRSFLRFDYSGHGASDGNFADGCLTDWISDANTAFQALAKGPQILVGSSMGAWIATHLALRHRANIAGIVFVAPAPDFTERLMWRDMDEPTRAKLMSDGKLEEPSDYSDEPMIITKKLIEDGRENLVMTGSIDITCSIRILQGMADPDVPFCHALEFSRQLASDDIEITLTKTGDHRLSTPNDLHKLKHAILSFDHS